MHSAIMHTFILICIVYTVYYSHMYITLTCIFSDYTKGNESDSSEEQIVQRPYKPSIQIYVQYKNTINKISSNIRIIMHAQTLVYYTYTLLYNTV